MFVEIETRVMTDGWAVYEFLQVLACMCTTQLFLVAEIHTQSVESLSKRAKAKLRKGNGTSEELLESYVKEAIWCENYALTQRHEVFQVFSSYRRILCSFMA